MTITGASHFTFSDQMFTKSPILLFFLRQAGVMGPLKKDRGLAISSACVQTFFDVYLNGAPASEVTGLLALYPELKMGVTSAFPPASSN
jgi:hypothetical protein